MSGLAFTGLRLQPMDKQAKRRANVRLALILASAAAAFAAGFVVKIAFFHGG